MTPPVASAAWGLPSLWRYHPLPDDAKLAATRLKLSNAVSNSQGSRAAVPTYARHGRSSLDCGRNPLTHDTAASCPRADVLAALADEEHAAPSGRGGRHGHHLTARNSGVLVRAGQLQSEAAPVHVDQPQNGVSTRGRMNVRLRRQRNDGLPCRISSRGRLPN
jgi:hypothetical protein